MENNFILRALSSGAMLLLILVIWLAGDAAFYIMTLVVALISYNEWLKMTSSKGALFKALGNFVILVPNASLIYIYDTNGAIFLWMLSSIWANDVGAYFVGKRFGGYKLCRRISPGKTWSGFIGGVICSFVVGASFLYFIALPYPDKYTYIFATLLLPLIATAGDLFESYVKRLCQVKDSGCIIPGHGGVLDRLDSFIFTAPFVAYLLFALN